MTSEEIQLLKQEIAELKENQEFLQFKLDVSHASSPTALMLVKEKLKALKKKDFTGSAVVVRLLSLGGRDLLSHGGPDEHYLICNDGLLPETIDALIKQVEISEELAWVYTAKSKNFRTKE